MYKCLAVMVLCSATVLAQRAKAGDHKGPRPKSAKESTGAIITPDSVKWADAPAMMPPGAQMAVLSGNPEGVGPFVVRLKMPDGYRVMPHWHPTSENVTVLSGEFAVGMGDKFDDKSLQPLPAGSFASVLARHHHYGIAKGETVLQVNAIGPFKLVYVNPEDDPSKKK